MLEQYMIASGSAECRVMACEFRVFFYPDESAGPALSGFLGNIHHGLFFTCRNKAVRMEKFRDTALQNRIIRKYRVREHPVQRSRKLPAAKNLPGKTVNLLLYYPGIHYYQEQPWQWMR